MSTVDTARDTAQDAQSQYFRVTDQVPEEVWYWAALGSIIVSATLFLIGKRDWSVFVGQWPPTFLLFGLFHKILRPFIQSVKIYQFDTDLRKKRENIPTVLRRTVATSGQERKAAPSLLPQTEIHPAPITKAVSML